MSYEPGEAEMRHRFRCEADTSAPRRVRKEVTSSLAGLDDEQLATAQLLVSELATNVVLHGGDQMAVDICRDPHRVRIEVTDPGEAMPVRREAGVDADSGRGLGLIDTASSRWGIEPRQPGKAVWFELPVHRSS
jgi:anti-sigma regulatory factor (Ser/Thr protein kinase)